MEELPEKSGNVRHIICSEYIFLCSSLTMFKCCLNNLDTAIQFSFLRKLVQEFFHNICGTIQNIVCTVPYQTFFLHSFAKVSARAKQFNCMRTLMTSKDSFSVYHRKSCHSFLLEANAKGAVLIDLYHTQEWLDRLHEQCLLQM